MYSAAFQIDGENAFRPCILSELSVRTILVTSGWVMMLASALCARKENGASSKQMTQSSFDMRNSFQYPRVDRIGAELQLTQLTTTTVADATLAPRGSAAEVGAAVRDTDLMATLLFVFSRGPSAP